MALPVLQGFQEPPHLLYPLGRGQLEILLDLRLVQTRRKLVEQRVPGIGGIAFAHAWSLPSALGLGAAGTHHPLHQVRLMHSGRRAGTGIYPGSGLGAARGLGFGFGCRMASTTRSTSSVPTTDA